ncbi:hypothetical protein VNO77_26974 [Canavalia gladiata]|uniref:Uncharacterized protein n=1 Tax=Canavalia gladiata TaxID=3824 RepID=A0AAN9KY06_CANGL
MAQFYGGSIWLARMAQFMLGHWHVRCACQGAWLLAREVCMTVRIGLNLAARMAQFMLGHWHVRCACQGAWLLARGVHMTGKRNFTRQMATVPCLSLLLGEHALEVILLAIIFSYPKLPCILSHGYRQPREKHKILGGILGSRNNSP